MATMALSFFFRPLGDPLRRHAGGIVPCLGCQVAVRDCKICRVISGLSRSRVLIEEPIASDLAVSNCLQESVPQANLDFLYIVHLAVVSIELYVFH